MSKNHFSGCLLCGQELTYSDSTHELACSICGNPHKTNVFCVDQHFVCDRCHSLGALDLIEQYCLSTDSIDAVRMMTHIMKMPVIHMHGPEHHFLVPAVLITAVFNALGNPHKKEPLAKARKRAETVPGGFCGFNGACGAGIGTGIFMSIITDTTPLSKESWQVANLMTAKSLERIALNGGPRCCKRDSYLAVLEAIEFANIKLNLDLPKSDIVCEFYAHNKQCLQRDCPFFPSVKKKT